MRIKSITLENIRSYSNRKIDFPEGSILLSGDIGSGKTTLLLAVDFVLFGLRKGNLSGNGLLRKGCDKGSVELNFEVNGKEVVIKRGLKKTSSGVSQEAGYFVLDGEKEDLSPVNLKQKILELFNYPKESLTRNKALVYNYTVYTPQEEMKNILLGDAEERLNILRRVFGIDKYKRIIENSKILVSKLKDRKKELDLLSSDLDDLKEEKLQKENRVKEVSENFNNLKNEIEVEKEKIINKRKELSELEAKNKERENMKRKLELLNSQLESFVNQRTRNTSVFENLSYEVNSLDREVREQDVKDVEVLNKKIISINENIFSLESEIKDLNKKIGEFEYLINESEKLKKGINDLVLCPVCKQKVEKEHKHNIEISEERKLKDVKISLEDSKKVEEEKLKLIFKLKEESENLRKEKSKLELFRLKKENLNSKRKQLEELLKEQNRLKEEIGNINSQKIGINSLLKDLPDVSLEYKKSKEELENILVVERRLTSELVANEREISLINERINELNNVIEKKIKSKEKVVKFSETIFYLENEFVSLLSSIEKQIMKKVHFDFDSVFKDWFRILVEDEDLEINLGSDFSPLIRRSGHDIDYNHLSGGERTAAALAYRLALNQVINTVMSEINTKGILILDEPTDGFSSEQVDKLRIVLEELNIGQVIIVSHDPKIESFVDNVIRFERKGGESFVH